MNPQREKLREAVARGIKPHVGSDSDPGKIIDAAIAAYEAVLLESEYITNDRVRTVLLAAMGRTEETDQ